MGKIDQHRRGEYLQTAFKVLSEHNDSLPLRELIAEIQKRLTFTEYEVSPLPKSGYIRWESVMQFYSIDCAKAGWLRKHKGVWYITEEGKKALSLPPEKFMTTATDAYRNWRKMNPKKEPDEVESDEEAISEDRSTVFQSAEGRAREEIAEYIEALNAYDFQDLVAALFRGMGYFTPFEAPKGKDGGIDIVAYKDPLGASPPRIRIQVKHRAGTPVSRAEVGDLISNLKKDGSVGVIVSTGGFSSDALMKIREANEHIEAIDLDRFITLWEEHYESLSTEDKILLPLKSVSFLAPEN
ncbi:MAG: Mrr restriction system protein [Candidatus Peribacteraceae bacterium]|nr:Mrr restriction system protein [Candidatus Peribacteraceae bacterium]MDD5739253.1 Mrr restriction system protein [Candidatus Peribacteraceae bacterium]